ncbi:Hypothetical Protein FCC1311_015262 [Hondaea fermentalgiana]|uniref:Uncharacterized protein n=1 Tax=Hondaea fermentalgiana TaxID=2315210 RepID=A0A2R5G4Q9_9STRA|nr:Hypothetical Protein FCC1311_015262 [Hondaea fermentalgiana]|eukprot:GBG25309.1 Hypothetical Protein FCC1311_015262 [Hondaea fermentalgiana]
MDEAVNEALLDDVWDAFERDDESVDSSRSSADEEADEEADDEADEAFTLNGRGQWNYESYSARGSEYYGDRQGLVRGMNMVSIDYNPANSILFDKVQRETTVLLERARNALNLSANGKIKALDAFRVALPPTFITMLVQWLSQVLRDSDTRLNVTRSDVWGFIMIHIILRATHQTFRRLESGRSSLHQECAIFIQGYRRVRKAMGLDRSSREDQLADETSPAASSMSGHLDEMEEAARSHWVRMFFVPSVTWVSIDDDKLPFSSETSENPGIRLTSTKRRKFQPVVHVVASITTGFISMPQADDGTSESGGDWDKSLEGTSHEPRAQFAASRAMPERDQIIDSGRDSKSSCENMNEADAGVRTNDFVKLVPKPVDRAQVVHHAAVLDVETVLLVYATPEEVRQVVAITVPLESRQAWRSYLHALSSEYMGFAYVEDNAVFPDVGTDHSEVYGYARDHHTVELYLQLWRSHNEDIQRYGTPPPCSKLLPQIVSFWNHMMGGVDTMRKVLSGHKVITSQLNPNCLLWITFLEYTLYNAFRLYQLSKMEKRAAAAQSFDEWSTQRKVVTFNGFLYDLMEDALETTSNLGQKQFCAILASHNIGSTDRDLRQLISTTSESPSAS